MKLTESCKRLALRIEHTTHSRTAAPQLSSVDDSENKPYPSRYLPTPSFPPASRLCSPHARRILFADTDTICEASVASMTNAKPVFEAASMYWMYTSFLTRPCSLCSFEMTPSDSARTGGGAMDRTAFVKLCLRCSFSLTLCKFAVSSRASTTVEEDGVDRSPA